MNDVAALRATRRWLEEVVVGLHLCPFAATPLKLGQIRFEVCLASEADTIYCALLTEMETLLSLPEEEAETSLFIVPHGLSAFDNYLDLLYSADEAIPSAGLGGVLQLASFHPDYCFEGAEQDDPANYTNRSPYPMFHLIREASLAKAIEGYPDAEQIPQRNIDKLRELGLQEIRRRLQACSDA